MYDIEMVEEVLVESGNHAELEAELLDVAGQLNLVNARLVELAERVLSTRSWEGTGMRTPAAYLGWAVGLSPERAKVVVRVAERRSEFPTIVSMFERGELSFEQVAEVVKAPPSDDGRIADLASIATVSKLRRAMRSTATEQNGGQPGQAPPADHLTFGATANGRWRIRGEFGIDDGRRVEAALTERKDALFTDGDDDVTWPEAFVDCMDRSLGAVESVPRRDRYRTWIHLDVTDGEATTTDGWRIPMAIRDRLLCDGVVQPVWERDGKPFSVGRDQRIVPDRTRRIVERRDRGCRVPGCTADRFVEIHHIVHWLDGGTTDTRNLISLCPKHHKMHHQGRLAIEGNADEFDGVTFTDERGVRRHGSGVPVLPTGPPQNPVKPYERPLRERFDWNWNWIGLGWIAPNERNLPRLPQSETDRAA